MSQDIIQKYQQKLGLVRLGFVALTLLLVAGGITCVVLLFSTPFVWIGIILILTAAMLYFPARITLLKMQKKLRKMQERWDRLSDDGMNGKSE